MMDVFGHQGIPSADAESGSRRPAPRPAMLVLSSRRLPLILAAVAFAHILLYAASKLAVGCGACEEIETYFHLDREANLPSWFSTMLWLIAAGLTAAVAATARTLVWHWRGLAATCTFLSLDEASMFHERFGNMLGSAVSAGDYLFYNWLLYGFSVAVIAGIAFLPFLRALPRDTAVRVFVAGGLFLSGAIGVEMLGGASRAGAIEAMQGRVFWGIQLMVEEFLEMLGIIALIHALLHHLSRHCGALSVSAR